MKGNEEAGNQTGEMTCLSREADCTMLDMGRTMLSTEPCGTMLSTEPCGTMLSTEACGTMLSTEACGTMLTTSQAQATELQSSAAPDEEQQEQYKIGDYIEDNYEVLAVHKGALGVVYAAYDHEDELPKGLKTLQKRYAGDKQVLDLFREEATLWVKLEKHPYIVRAYRVDSINEQPYVVMEYITSQNGSDLRSWLGSPKLTLPVAVEMGLKIAQGMQYVQQKVPGLIHRDLKPANILVDEYAQPYITDFGLAYATGSDAGTPAYMAPEQWRKEALSIQTDIYAYGCILYEMLTGHRMYTASTVDVWRYMHLSQLPVPLGQIKPEIPPELEQFVQKCIDKVKEHRPQSWDEVVEVMAGWSYQLTGQPPVMDFSTYKMSARELLTATSSLITLEKIPEALATSERIIETDPDFINGWYIRALILRQLQRTEEMKECYNRGLEINPDFESHSYSFKHIDGSLLTSLERYDEALECYDMMLEERADDVNVLTDKGITLKCMECFTEAMDCINQALEIDPDYPLAIITKSKILLYLERHEEALEYCDRYLNLEPEASDGWFTKGVLLLKLDYYEESISCFDHPHETPGAETLFNKGVALSILERYHEAIQCFDAALELKPDYKESWREKAFCLMKLERYQEALDYLNHALELEPNYDGLLDLKGRVLYNMGSYQEAFCCCEKAIELNQENELAWKYKVDAIKEQFGLEGCLPYFERDLKAYPLNINVWYEKGLVLYQLNRDEESLDCFNRVLEIDPNHCYGIRYKGLILYYMGRSEESLHYFNRAFEMKVKDFDYEEFFCRGILLDKFGDYDAAIDSFDHALALLPNKASYLNAKGRTLYHMGRYEEAVESCDKALAINPESIWGLEYKGKSLKRLNLDEKGDACLEKLFKLKPDLDIWDDY